MVTRATTSSSGRKRNGWRRLMLLGTLSFEPPLRAASAMPQVAKSTTKYTRVTSTG